MIGNQAIENELNILIDWLSFTVFVFSDVKDVVEYLGFSINDFIDMPRGAHGYKKHIKYVGANINIFFDGSEDMGIHVDVSASGIWALLEGYKNKLAEPTPFGGVSYDLWQETVLKRLIDDIFKVGKFTRVDLAVDDFGAKYYSLGDVAEKIRKCEYIAKWRTNRELVERKGMEITGHTVYFGSQYSDIMLRIYDKKREYNKNKKVNDGDYFPFEWTRWELQMRGEKSCAALRYLQEDMTLGAVAVGILSHYFRLIVIDDSNKSRCSLDDKWALMISSISPLRLRVNKPDKTIEDKDDWIYRQVAPSLSICFEYHGGDMEYIYSLLENGRIRRSSADLRLLGEMRCVE